MMDFRLQKLLGQGADLTFLATRKMIMVYVFGILHLLQ